MRGGEVVCGFVGVGGFGSPIAALEGIVVVFGCIIGGVVSAVVVIGAVVPVVLG